MASKFGCVAISGIVGGLIGFVGGFIMSAAPGNHIEIKAQIFPEYNPNFLVVYNPIEGDNVLVQDSNAPNSFISKEKYLDSLPTKYDRAIKKLKIEEVLDL